MSPNFRVKEMLFKQSVFVCVLFLLGCGDYKREQDEANAKYQKLNAMYEKLMSENKELSDKLSDLKNENENLRSISAGISRKDSPRPKLDPENIAKPPEQWCSSVYEKALLSAEQNCSAEYVPNYKNPATGRWEPIGPPRLPTIDEKKECMIDAVQDADVEIN